MPLPRVFVSSTFYDLRYIRENMKLFIRNMGFEPVLSEDGNVFYNPRQHVQDACLSEVQTCQLFVLIIGSHYGSKYKETPESITNHEYKTAVENKTRIFALVEQQVLNEYNFFIKNRENPEVDETKIIYPSVSSTKIFNFVEEVKSNAINNALVPFAEFQDIEIYLKQQWASMMYNFLTKDSESERVSNLLSQINAMSQNIEFLSKQILSAVGSDTANIMAEIYDMMLQHGCIRDLAYAGIRPSPIQILNTDSFEELGKPKLRINERAKGYTIGPDGYISRLKYNENAEDYLRLRNKVLKRLEQIGKQPEKFIEELKQLNSHSETSL
nr:DUF4062 domain-containing protein [Heliobacterium chlorum]